MNRLAKFGIVAGAGLLGGAGMDVLMQDRGERLEANVQVVQECRGGEREVTRSENGLECGGIRVYEQLGTVALGEPVQIDWYATEKAVQDRLDARTSDRIFADTVAAGFPVLITSLGIVLWENGQRQQRNRGGTVQGRRIGVTL